jgi:hypothetical protein
VRQGTTNSGPEVYGALLLVILGSGANSHAADPWNDKRFLVFGEDHLGWVAVAMPTMEVRPILIPALEPEGVALSPDSVTVAFTAPDKTVETSLLYVWRLDSRSPPKSIGDSHGYHADPVFGPDGSWVYFAHSPFGRGAPGAHGGMAFAELYRVRPDGSGLEALTSSPGCHVQPFVGELSRVLFAHVNCGRHGQHIEQLGPGEPDESRVLPGEWSAEPDLSPDGRLLLVSTQHLHRIAWERWTLGRQPMRDVEHVVVNAPRHLRPRFGHRRDEVLYQTRDGIVLHSDTEEHLVSRFGGGQL